MITEFEKDYIEKGVKHFRKELEEPYPDFYNIFFIESWYMTLEGKYDKVRATRINNLYLTYLNEIIQKKSYEKLQRLIVRLRGETNKSIANINTTIPIDKEEEQKNKPIDWRLGDIMERIRIA